MSTYQVLLSHVESLKCPKCGGLGESDDAELGDISFKVWTCTYCKGTGFRNGETYQATPLSGDPVR